MRSTQVPAGDLYRPHADPGTGHGKTTADLFTDWYFHQAAHVRGASHRSVRQPPGAEAEVR
jgi:hypothetical protein